MRTATRPVLAALLLLTGGSAIWGGYMLVEERWPLDPGWLRHTPFDTWTIPGVATMLLPGACVTLAGVAVLFSLPRHRIAGLAAGLGLVAWVLVELAWLRIFHPVMHPLILGVGILAAILAVLLPLDRNPARYPSRPLSRTNAPASPSTAGGARRTRHGDPDP